MMNKEQLETIKKGYQWWLEAENQADKNEFAECITTQDVPTLIAEVERLQRFKNYFDYLHGKGLGMANWHQNGDLELFDNFYKEAVNFMEKESCD